MNKPYLIKATIQDGEHEHYVYGTVQAKNESEAWDKAVASAPHDDCELDTDDSIWGFGRGSDTGTRIRDIYLLTKEEENTINKFHIATPIEAALEAIKQDATRYEYQNCH